MNTTYGDFSKAAVLTNKNASDVEKKAVLVLLEEVFKRTGIKLPVTHKFPNAANAVIAVGDNRLPCMPAAAMVSKLQKPEKEGYRLAIEKKDKLFCAIIGEDGRGVLYGVGKALRLMNWGDGKLLLPLSTAVSSAPKFPVRGHQLAYRPKTNAYDAWSPEIFEQYIRELALFGANSIDILPPATDDEPRNNLMIYDPTEMMCRLSEIIRSYGLEVGLWYPNMFGEDISERDFSEQLKEREEIFSKIPFLDNLFIPGGDPGKLFPQKLFEVSERFLSIAKKHHQGVKLWISPQTFCPNREWTEGFYAELDKKPEWLYGVCFAPWVRDNIGTMRKRTPKHIPIRNYADICHSLRCQYPVPDWNLTQALTLGREFINPRPVDEKNIHNLYCNMAVGSVCYSEGINDDVNKFIWLDQEWNPKTAVRETLADYGRLFIDCGMAQEIADGLMSLEKNLRGEPSENPIIDETYEKWTGMEKRVGRYAANNYRFEMPFLRAVFDLYQKNRSVYERVLEKKALETLAQCTTGTVDKGIRSAREILKKVETEPVCPALRQRIDALADLLFEHIGAQLTVSRHHASAWNRGAFVECVDIPLNDKRYILTELDKAEKSENVGERLAAVMNIVNRTDPGEGGFYDCFGSKESRKRLENCDNYAKDPGFFDTPLLSFLMPPPHDGDDNLNVPLAWRQNVYALYQKPLVINYDGLDGKAEYTIRAVYGKYHPIHIRLDAGEDGEIPVHGEIFVDEAFVTAEYPLPKKAYADGKLRLKLTVRDGERGPNVSEVMIRRAKN